MIPGNQIWNQNVAAMSSQSRPLYTFEIPDEGLIITSFIPSEANVDLDLINLLTQPLWNQSYLTSQALLTPTLPPTVGEIFPGTDGYATVTPPSGSISRFNFDPSLTSPIVALSWYGTQFPVGMQNISNAVTIDLLITGSVTNNPGNIFVPTASAAYTVTQFHDIRQVYTNFLTGTLLGPQSASVRLWPGNLVVGSTQPDINKIEVQVQLLGSDVVPTLGSVFTFQPSLVITFLQD